MDSEREKRLKDFNQIIRSVLMSASRGVPKHKLGPDYRDFVGKSMNESLQQLGYRSLDDYVRNNGHVVREATGPTGQPTYFAVATSDTEHVAKLIARQKKPSLKKMTHPPPRPLYQNPRKFYNAAPLPRMQRGHFSGKGFQRHHPTGPSSFKSPGYARQQFPSQQKYFGNSVGGNQWRPGGGYQQRPGAANSSFNSATKQQLPYKSHTSPGIKPGATQYYMSESRTPTGFLPGTPTSSPPDSLKAQTQGIPPWKPEFGKVEKTFHTVEELFRTKGQYDHKMICVYGFPGGADKLTQYPGECRVLLSDSDKTRIALNLFFQKPRWDISVYPDPLNLCKYEGVKLKVVGVLTYKLWKNRGQKVQSMAVIHYEKMFANSQTPLTVTVPNSSDPQRRREVTMEKTLSSSSNSINSSSSSSSLDVGSSGGIDSETKQWLKKILSSKPNGLWFKVLVKNYEEKFHRSCSLSSFLESISALPFIKLDEVGISGNPIVVLVKEIEPPPAANQRRNSHSASRASPPQVQEVEKPTFPGRVVFPSDSEWADVFVVCADSPLEFYVQLTDENHSEAFQRMTAQMNKYFNAASKEAPLKMGVVLSNREEELFASCWGEDEHGEEGSWCRTMVEGPTSSESMVMVHYPDYGNSGELEITELRRLPTEFYKLPFQSIPCYLEGVKENSQEALDLFSNLAFEKSGVVRVTKRDEEKTGVDLLVDNESIKTTLLDTLYPVETLVPSIPESGRVAVKLTDVDKSEEKLLAVQVVGLGTKWLGELSEILKATIQKGMKASRMFSKGEVTEGTVCCCIREDQCYRVRVKEVLERWLLVEYLDYGNKELVEATSLRKELEGERVFKLPPQAVRCSLHGVPPHNGVVTEKVVNWLGEYFDADNLQLEMVPEGGCQLWHGETNVNALLLANDDSFFQEECFVPSAGSSVSEQPSSSSPASPSDGESSLFDTARQCSTPETFGAPNSGEQRSQCLLSPKSAPFVPLSPASSPSSLGSMFSPGSLPSGVCTPKELLPDDLFCSSVVLTNLLYERLEDHGEPVRLTPLSVQSPHDFTVQLERNSQQLEEMQTRLQKHCNAASSRKLTEFREGLVCVAHSREYGRWYRAVLVDNLMVRSENGRMVEEVNVKFVDYGNVETVSVLDVRVLPKAFLELPFQGISARLAGVAPIIDRSCPEQGWSLEACSHFEELLFEKEQTIFGMATGEMRGVYSVRLIQNPSGHLIGEVLVERGLARAV